MKQKQERPLTEAQKRAAEMLFHYRRVKDVASALGVHRSTIWRWKKLRAFRKEWSRLDRNADRRFKRKMEKLRAEQDAYWSQREKEADKKLHETAQNPRKKAGKILDRAWDEYTKALFRGRNMEQLLSDIMSEKA